MPQDPVQLLPGQKALVAGGSSSIREGVVRALAAAGAAVGVNYRSHSEEAERIVDDIRGAYGKAVALKAVVSDEAEVQAVLASSMRSGASTSWWRTQASKKMAPSST
ncbi:MAG: SDR family NAD(P)-dependent oxidoreductase [Xanthobacteraceae bacterium]|nr:SDR family NAD(P)-dependent oxidoreductase [Xanthobacteraceae bacterium]